MFECHAVFETFKRLLETPSLMVEVAEGGRRMALHVEKIGDEHAHLAGWRDLPDQPNGLRGSRTLIVARVDAGWSREPGDGLITARAHKALYGSKAATVGTHAERNVSLVEHGHQPAGWVAAVEQKQVVGLQAVQMFEEDLAFVLEHAVQ